MLQIALWLGLLLSRTSPDVEFERDIQPILEQRCQPCHFPGGQMHAKLPFDRAETIDRLGERLFTRIKKEREQELIRRYLAQRRAAS